MNVLIIGSSFLGVTGTHGIINVCRAGSVFSACNAAEKVAFDLIVISEGACADSSSDWVRLIGLLRGALVVDESSVPLGDLLSYAAVVAVNKRRDGDSAVQSFASEVVGEIESCLALLRSYEHPEAMK